MNDSLIPCERCHRHVFAGEAVCPFCRSALAGPGRAALAAVALSAGLVIAGCERPPAPVYGGPPPIGSEQTDRPTAAAYGAPPPVASDTTPVPTASTAPTAPAPTTSATAAPEPSVKPITKPVPTTKPHPTAIPAYGLAPRKLDDR